jgi:uncharacterized protein (TIGR00299 family) protein
MRTLFFDCFAGASGNMILGSLIAAGVDRDELVAELGKMELPGFQLAVECVDRSGISAIHVDVQVPDESLHRHLSDIEVIINRSELADSVKARSIAIFRRLAEAEAKIHGTVVGKVHFHEVGALDAIIDVVGSCIGFEMLGIERFACSKIHVGSGFVEMEHGKFPIPPPAVAELLQGIPVYSTEIEGELVTPTGAAIISTVCYIYGPLRELSVERTSYGAGSRKYDRFPNVLRIMIGEAPDRRMETPSNTELLTLLETNIDDLSPQVLGFTMERAFELGALDCWFTPIQMKKDRPASMLSVLCRPADRNSIRKMIYEETSTLGIRTSSIERHSLDREVIKVSTRFGTVDVKIGRLDGKVVNAMPEYDQVRKLALENGVPFRMVLDAASANLNSSSFTAAK